MKSNNVLLNYPKIVIGLFALLLVISVYFSTKVSVNTDLSAYLPEDMPSVIGAEVLMDAFKIEGTASVMLNQMDIEEALVIKNDIEALDGVDRVIWLDMYMDLGLELDGQEEMINENFYKDQHPLMQIMFESSGTSDETFEAIDQMKDIIGDKGVIAGESAISKHIIETVDEEVKVYMAVAVVLILFILIVSTSSYIEPFLFLTTIGVAIGLNLGSNYLFGEISQMTFSSASILQLAVSMDYSIFLLHRFHEEREAGKEVKQAMSDALKYAYKPILASGLTTVAGFFALTFMDFGIGRDMGLVLGKGVLLSLLVVLVLLPSLMMILDGLIERYTHKAFVMKGNGLAKVFGYIRIPALFIIPVLAVIFFMASNNINYYYGNDNILPASAEPIMAKASVEEVYGPSNNLLVLVPDEFEEAERALLKSLGKVEGVYSASGLLSAVDEDIPLLFVPREIKRQFRRGGYSLITLELSGEKDSNSAFTIYENVLKEVEQDFEEYYVVGETATYYDLKAVTEKDYLRTTILSVIFIVIIIGITFKSLSIPVIAILVIEVGIWVNLGIAYFTGEKLSFLSYIIIGAIQLGATIDYAILLMSRYKSALENEAPKAAAATAIKMSWKSIAVSSSILIVACFSVYFIANVKTTSEMCLLIGRGAILSVIGVMLVLPGLLVVCDPLIKRTTLGWPKNQD